MEFIWWILLVICGVVLLTKIRQSEKFRKAYEEFREGCNEVERAMEIEKNKTSKKNTETEKNNPIPTTCPHCKNPNTKRLRECEWCGNGIFA